MLLAQILLYTAITFGQKSFLMSSGCCPLTSDSPDDLVLFTACRACGAMRQYIKPAVRQHKGVYLCHNKIATVCTIQEATA